LRAFIATRPEIFILFLIIFDYLFTRGRKAKKKAELKNLDFFFIFLKLSFSFATRKFKKTRKKRRILKNKIAKKV